MERKTQWRWGAASEGIRLRGASTARTFCGRTAQNFQSAQRGGGARFDAEDFQNFQHVFFHRGFADAEDAGDLSIRLALGDPKQDFGDARSEVKGRFERDG